MSDKDFDTQWEHFRELVTHMFGETGQTCPESDVVWYPATDVYQTADELIVRMDLSGVRREDIRILLQGEMVEVRGIRRDTSPPGKKRFHSMEIAVGPFKRRLRVPESFARGVVSTGYRDGILEIRLEARRRRVESTIEIVIEEMS